MLTDRIVLLYHFTGYLFTLLFSLLLCYCYSVWIKSSILFFISLITFLSKLFIIFTGYSKANNIHLWLVKVYFNSILYFLFQTSHFTPDTSHIPLQKYHNFAAYSSACLSFILLVILVIYIYLYFGRDKFLTLQCHCSSFSKS